MKKTRRSLSSSLLNEAPHQQYGTGLVDVEQTCPICKVCQKKIMAKDNNTTNLFHHLKYNHKLQYDERQQMRQDNAAASSTAATSSGK